MKLKTARLGLVPMDREALAAFRGLQTDEALRADYDGKLEQISRDPKNEKWYTVWRICPKKTQTIVGVAGFGGPPSERCVAVQISVDASVRNRGYASEALKAMCGWAFGNEDVYFIRAQCAPENAAGVRVLEKNGFRRIGGDGELWELERPQTAWLPIYMCLGMSVGLALGTALDQLAVGMCIGMAVGAAVGGALDAGNRKKREKPHG